MINKIENLKDFGIYKNFNWNSIPSIEDFKYKNIIYGWNYSGKTTFSRIFSSLRDKEIFKDFSNGDFKIVTTNGNYDKTNLTQFPYKVLVFNSDYIKDNLKWDFDEEINAIYFEVGENAKHTKRIEDIGTLIVEIVGSDKVVGKRKKFQDSLNEYNLFEDSLFPIEAKKIKDEHFISLINFTKADVRKIKDQIRDNIDSNIIKDKKELSKVSKVIKIEEPKAELDFVEFTDNITRIIDLANEILKSSPEKSEVIEILDKNENVYNWVKNGLEFNSKNNPISEDRFNLLTSYFQNKASKLRLKGQELFEQINKEDEAIIGINFPNSTNDLNEGFQDEYKAVRKQLDKLLSSYKSYIKKTKTKIQNKLASNLYTSLPEIENFNTNSLKTKFKELNKLIKSNNEFTSDFSKIIASEREKYKKHLVSTFLKSSKYLLKERKFKTAQIAIQKLDEVVNGYVKEIERLKALRLSDSEGCAQFNSFVQSFLSREDIEIKQNETTKKFILKRGSELAKNLSEGEKMAISFSHFLVTLRSIELKNELIEYIIFIDDPISSLDGNHIFQINSLLKETFFEQKPDPNQPNQMQWKLKCKQIFFSTHNFEFFNLLKEMPVSKTGFSYSSKAVKSKESRYFISRNILDSHIEKLPEVYNSYSSEYHYLFSEIVNFNNSANQSTYSKLLLMPNILRRFLEMYTLTQYPSSDELDGRADVVFGKAISKRICKPFHYFSHFNNIDRIGKQSELVADISSACRTLIMFLENKEDKKHYEALKKAISI